MATVPLWTEHWQHFRQEVREQFWAISISGRGRRGRGFWRRPPSGSGTGIWRDSDLERPSRNVCQACIPTRRPRCVFLTAPRSHLQDQAGAE